MSRHNMDDHFERMLGLGGRKAVAEQKDQKESSGQPFIPSGQSFIPSKTFTGPKPGYVFRRDKQGTGYYLDALEMEKVSPSLCIMCQRAAPVMDMSARMTPGHALRGGAWTATRGGGGSLQSSWLPL